MLENLRLRRRQAVVSIGAGAVAATLALFLPHLDVWLIGGTFLLQFVVPAILLSRFQMEVEPQDRWARQLRSLAGVGAAALVVLLWILVPALKIPLLVGASWVWFCVYLHSIRQKRLLAG